MARVIPLRYGEGKLFQLMRRLLVFGVIQKKTIGALAGLVLTWVLGQASVIYTFVGTGLPDEPVAFVLTVPTFITPNPLGPAGSVTFTCAQLDSSTNCSDSPLPGISFTLGSTIVPKDALLQFDATNATLYNFLFANDAFATPDIYNAHGYESVTLTVASVPEPQTLLQVSTGLMSGFCVAYVRWRRRYNRDD